MKTSLKQYYVDLCNYILKSSIGNELGCLLIDGSIVLPGYKDKCLNILLQMKLITKEGDEYYLTDLGKPFNSKENELYLHLTINDIKDYLKL